jgi:hypothetical protein
MTANPMGGNAMRVMAIVKATKDSEAGMMPGPELMAAMGAFNQSLIEAGVFIDAGGLKASGNGARVGLSGEDRTVTNGPFASNGENGGLTSGYWIWKVKDLDEAIDWARRCPSSPSGPFEIEIRPLFEIEDFG